MIRQIMATPLEQHTPPKKGGVMAYDARCHELATYFLNDEPDATEDDADVLAQHIQDAIEDWLNYDLKDRHRPPEDKLTPNDRGEQFAPIDDDVVF